MSDKSDFSKREEEILEFWNKEKIFEKTLSKDAPKGEYVFYDGPPFATGLPHYGHVLPGTMKDAIPRYKTMRGYHVPRRWGWDCHGLPLEAQVEKEFGISTKQEIVEKVGIENFVEQAKRTVLRYRGDWQKIIPRLGRFVDMENDYRTMDPSYTESVWWVFKNLYDKKLIYKGFKSLHLSPLLGTELSNIEVAQGYKNITDFAVTVRLPLKGEEGELLVWTTTPWTLPGNMAAAVHPELTYIKVRVKDEKVGGVYIIAKDRQLLFSEMDHEVIEELQGTDLVGKEYEPPFAYYKDEEFANKENAWKIYPAEYVTAEDGTGAVHLAPAFGAEDLELAREFNIPVIHHVDKGGKFVDVVKDFAGMDAKPKDDHQATDIEIIKYLAHAGKLFKKEKIEHSYPHSWRTDEPLLNYAMDSWFVDVPQITDKLVAQNEKVHWVPEEVGSKRFGNWLKGGRDWSISRSRFWGAPLPVWESEGEDRIVLGSLEELKQHVKKSGNRYTLMRHGEAETNKTGRLTHNDSIPSSLTDAGKEKARETARALAKKGITKVFASPLKRTQETAAIVAEELGLPKDAVIVDERIREINFGEFNGKTVEEYHAFFNSTKDLFTLRPEAGESWYDVRQRVGDFLYDLEASYKNEEILIVTHNSPAFMMSRVVSGDDVSACAAAWEKYGDAFIVPGDVRDLSFIPIPHNAKYELDYHRPYIDEIVLEKNGKEYRRIQDVFDCWFESGSMPYGQKHYPFENLDTFNPKQGLFQKAKGYPAEFIAEGLDQTRGWFYSLLVLGIALFGRAPYKNVVVHGIVLAEDGQKMSKKLKNYPDVMDVVNTYGADALRYYLLSSPVVRGEDLAFSEAGVKEVAQKIVARLHNVSTFYNLYREVIEPKEGSVHVLDRWIMSRLNSFMQETTQGFEAYEFDKASRPLLGFVDDLSTWYVRRSRDRIKNGGEDAAHAMHTLKTVLLETSKVMAPIMPFHAEYLYRSISTEDAPESVHLCAWPEAGAVDELLLSTMSRVRDVVSVALQERQDAGFKVRQPLKKLTLPEKDVLSKEYQELIQEEVNVEEVVFAGEKIKLDTELTPELREKGLAREFIRAVQEARKAAGLSPHDKIILTVAGSTAFLEPYKDELIASANIERIQRVQDLPGGQTIDLGEQTLTIRVVHA